ncbi:MAG: Uncharacterized protein FD135_2518 [Comamonadaceae bacterium]|nr:MAG: Uncharacterized protein FD135_2518 [Comamonadaceae bacterium]
MSYDIRIWEHPAGRPTPTTLEEAGRSMLELEKTRPGVNPKFIALAQKMIEGHTYSAMYPSGDRAAQDATWLGNPVQQAKELAKAVWAVELPEEDRVGMLRFMVDNATGLGLAVFDEQIGMAFLPGGIVLPQAQRAMWDGLKEEMASMPEPTTKPQMRKAMLAKVTPIFERHGFEARKSKEFDMEFFRTVEDGASQRVVVRVEGTSPDFRYWVCAYGYDSRIRSIVEAVCDIDVFSSPDIFYMPLGLIGGLPGGGGVVDIDSNDKVRLMLSALESRLIPALNLARCLQGLDELLNGDFSEKLVKDQWEKSLAPLIVARLAGQRDFEKFSKEYLAFYEALPILLSQRELPSLKNYQLRQPRCHPCQAVNNQECQARSGFHVKFSATKDVIDLLCN